MLAGVDNSFELMPDETVHRKHIEGSLKQVYVNRYERDVHARAECIAHYGATCVICCFNFNNAYGRIAEGFIHVHHLKSLSEIKEEYEVDPINDLRPVCPNCHAVIHIGKKTRTIEEMRELIRERGRNNCA
jgi:predicted HNH restriction endonuclease